MNQPLAVGNWFVIRKYEPEIRMGGVVTRVGEKYSHAVVTKVNRSYDFRSVEVNYIIDMEVDDIEVLELPSKEVLA